MLKIIYSTEGKPISDFQVYDFVDTTISMYKNSSFSFLSVNTSNELCLMTFCLRVLEGKIPLDEVEFYFEDTKLNFDPIHGLEDLPDRHIGFLAEVTERSLKVICEK